MIVVGVDPGYEFTSLVIWDGTRVVFHVHEENARVIDRLRTFPLDTPLGGGTTDGVRIKGAVLVIEQIESMGMAVGKTTFETVRWAGRFEEAWFPKRVDLLPRRIIKIHLCGQARATDSNIRQALIDRFGPSTEKAIGKKASPGPLYQITAHKLAALAVALTWADRNANAPAGEVLRPNTVAEF